jgi:hypothetical protein
MTTLASLVDFEFRSDFEAPDTQAANPDRLDTVSVTASELAELLANARAQGFEAANKQYALQQDTRYETLSDELTSALGELLELAKCLERVALSPDEASRVKTLIIGACSHIVAGQGDLFADQ